MPIRTADGVDLFYRRWQPDGATRAVVLVAHGMSEHSGRYERLAGVLTARGFAVYAMDHRGHGETSASTGVGRTGPAGMDGVLDDIGRIEQLARDEIGDVPIVLFGHSMGALLSLAYAERHGERLAGLALSGSPGVHENLHEMVANVQAGVDAAMGDQPIEALAPFSDLFQSARTPFDWLSRDEAEVDAYIADPYCGANHPVTYGFHAALLATAVASQDEISALPSHLPVLLLTGAADPVSNNGENVRLLEKRLRDAGLTVDAIYYDQARHEILNETNRDEVHNDLLTWLGRVVG
jgi:alpha-beta hydrolase superfamily lysophospholipase